MKYEDVVNELSDLYNQKDWSVGELKRWQFLLNIFRGGKGKTPKDRLCSPNINPSIHILEKRISGSPKKKPKILK
tara:strand:- start:1 stop:225 length:225 start_codon:yes stop_codon:yes gene_type:complete